MGTVGYARLIILRNNTINAFLADHFFFGHTIYNVTHSHMPLLL